MTKKQSVVAKSIVSHRLNVTSIDLFLDDLMKRLPRDNYNLADDAIREHFRTTLQYALYDLLRNLAWDFAKAAERGIGQMAELMRDPNYYDTLQRRRESEAARRTREREDQLKENRRRTELQAGYILENGRRSMDQSIMVGCSEDNMISGGCWHTASRSVECACICHKSGLSHISKAVT